jgi:hypothetical protein
MGMSELEKVDEIKTIEPESPDDAFICCASFEPRCKGATQKLAASYRTQFSIIFWYKEPNRTELRKKYMGEIKQELERVSKSLIIIESSRNKPVEGIRKLQEEISEVGLSLCNKRVTLDISTFTKQYALVLLKLLNESKSGNCIRVLYTEPEEYGPHRGGRLTEGLEKIVSVPFFGGYYNIEMKKLLVLFLGYEGERALAIWEEYAPDRTIAFIGKPGYRKGWEKVSEELNHRLLEMPVIEKRTVSTLSPTDVIANLEKIYEIYKDWNIYISPLGSKIQALGIYLFAKQHPEIQIVYAIPLEYPEEDYSGGIGPTRFFYLDSPTSDSIRLNRSKRSA